PAVWEASTPAMPEAEDALLAFQESMRAFLQTQHAVLAAYLATPMAGSWLADEVVDDHPFVAPRDKARPGGADLWLNGGPEWPLSTESSLETSTPTTSSSEPGPWVGAVRRLVAGTQIEAVSVFDSRDDPIAENHTLGGRRVSALDPSLKGLP